MLSFSFNRFLVPLKQWLFCYRVALPKTALNAEWEKDWKETDFEGDLSKLQKEAEERLDEKIAELNANIAKTGAEN